MVSDRGPMCRHYIPPRVKKFDVLQVNRRCRGCSDWPATHEPARDPMTHQHLIVETKGRVGVIRLNRPQALNALNTELMSELAAVIDAFEADAGIGCMVITGSDKAFAAGADINEVAAKAYMAAFMGNFAASG